MSLIWAIFGALRSCELDDADPADLHPEPGTPEPQLHFVEPFAPDMDSGADYLRRNNCHILAEHIKYAPMFQKYYDPLDFDARNYIK